MNKKMLLPLLIVSCLAVVKPAAAPQPQTNDSWLHVRVEGRETVRINVPLSLAEKVLPAIQVDKMHHGRIQIGHDKLTIEPHEFLAAVRDTPDGVFVTVESKEQNVKVAKENGYLVVQVRPGKKDSKQESVDVRLPMDVLEAMIGKGTDELDIVAALRVLASHRDLPLIRVTDSEQTVRIWIDNKVTGD